MRRAERGGLQVAVDGLVPDRPRPPPQVRKREAEKDEKMLSPLSIRIRCELGALLLLLEESRTLEDPVDSVVAEPEPRRGG